MACISKQPSPVAGITLDTWRHILYVRLQSGAVQVLLTLLILAATV